ncbi:MAG: zinc-dependent metalloprotease [Acidimicrobiales bacterium]
MSESGPPGGHDDPPGPGGGPGDPDEPDEPYGGGGNPFQGLPFFGDLARLLQQGPMSWDAARQLAVQIATEGRSEPNVDPLERMKVEQLARVADLQVAAETGLSTSIAGRPLSIAPVTRTQWVQRSADAYRRLLEQVAGGLTSDATSRLAEAEAEVPAGDPMAAFLGQITKLLGPVMVGMTSGSMIGHLARRSFGQYDLPIPRPPDDELLLVTPNINRFVDEWSLPLDDVLLWVCLHEITHHAVLGVPHVRSRLQELLGRYAGAFRPDPRALEDRLGELDVDPMSPSGFEQIQQAFGDPEVLLGALQSTEQEGIRPSLDGLVAVIVGYVDHVMDQVGEKLIGSYPMLTEALRRRRVEADPSDRFVERLFGLELTQAAYLRGSRFVDGVAERAGSEGVARLWRSERELPTPAEVDAPGLWLARIDLPTD